MHSITEYSRTDALLEVTVRPTAGHCWGIFFCALADTDWMLRRSSSVSILDGVVGYYVQDLGSTCEDRPC